MTRCCLVDVFFRGYGQWHAKSNDDDTCSISISPEYEARGVFKLIEQDEITYKHTKNLETIGVKMLLPSEHPDCEYTKLIGYGGGCIDYDKDNRVFFLKKDQPAPITLVIAEPYSSNNIETKTDHEPNNGKGRRQAQVKLLLSVIDELGNGRFNIPEGEKKKARGKCLESPKIFTSESVFNRVWSELSNSDQISIAGKEKFLLNQ